MSRTINIYVRDNNKKLNFELMEFLHKNITTTTVCGNVIIPRIINREKEKEFATNKHISKLPAIIYQNKVYEGKTSIKDLIKRLCKKKNFVRKKTQDELDVDDLRDYQQSVIESTPQDDDEEDEENVQSRLVRAAAWSQAKSAPPERADLDNYKDMEEDIGGAPPVMTGRDDNINHVETDEDIANLAQEDAGADSEFMDALMEKIGVSNL